MDKNDFLKEIEGLIEETESELKTVSGSVVSAHKNTNPVIIAKPVSKKSFQEKKAGMISAGTGVSASGLSGRKHPHAGHRGRMKDSFDTDPDFESFSDIQILEYLLFNTIPRIDTNVLAHDLIDTFGSFSGVLNANVAELKALPHISEETARMLTSILPAARRAEISRLRNNAQLQNIAQSVEYLAPYFQNRGVEYVYLASLSNSDRVISVDLISVGDTNFSAVEFKKIIEAASRHKASKVILAHNHPSGNTQPSAEDRELTARLAVVLLSVNIVLIDHLIFTADGSYSFFGNREFETIYEYADKIYSTNLVKELRLKQKNYRAGVFPTGFDDELYEKPQGGGEYSYGHPDPKYFRIRKQEDK